MTHFQHSVDAYSLDQNKILEKFQRYCWSDELEKVELELQQVLEDCKTAIEKMQRNSKLIIIW